MKPLSHNSLKGNWATLLLATNDKEEIDHKALEDEIDYLISSTPNGIYSNGTAGEFYTQTEDEFIKVNELLALKCERSGTPFQIGVSHTSPQISLERLKLIKHLRPGAVQVILPDWFPVIIDEAIDFMMRIEDVAEGIPLVLYNPPHAKKILKPSEWMRIKEKTKSFIGVKVFDNNRDSNWYKDVNETISGISVFIPGHHLATGLLSGMHGSYSNMACLNPVAAQKWYLMINDNPDDGLELEKRILLFMEKLIAPFITRDKYPNQACDRFMALVGGWANIGSKMRWPYRSIPVEYIEKTRAEAMDIIPEFFKT